MNYRPYPDAERAIAQVKRGRVPEPPKPPMIRTFEEFMLYVDSGEFQRRVQAIGESVATVLARNQARRGGKDAITAAITDQAVKAGEHVHVAGRDGVRCAGGDPTCSLPNASANRGPQQAPAPDGAAEAYARGIRDAIAEMKRNALGVIPRLEQMAADALAPADDAEVTGE
ncbi:hypothetical protein ACF1AX_31240 [Streptomyces sp. NPDC014802]|uniref:hypothetical protein n=1 Tax=Streptomyces sp. NPDC014802 TaxID=3364917 RepID=UPI0036FFFF08